MSGFVAYTAAVAATVWLVAATAKMRDMAGLAAAVRAFGVPRRWSNTASFATVGTELACLVLCVVPATRSVGLVASAALLVAFTAAIWRALRRGERFSCACFGKTSSFISGASIARNTLLIAVTMSGAAVGFATQPSVPSAPGVAVSAVSAVVTTAVLVYLDDLVSIFRGSFAIPGERM